MILLGRQCRLEVGQATICSRS